MTYVVEMMLNTPTRVSGTKSRMLRLDGLRPIWRSIGFGYHPPCTLRCPETDWGDVRWTSEGMLIQTQFGCWLRQEVWQWNLNSLDCGSRAFQSIHYDLIDHDSVFSGFKLTQNAILNSLSFVSEHGNVFTFCAHRGNIYSWFEVSRLGECF